MTIYFNYPNEFWPTDFVNGVVLMAGIGQLAIEGETGDEMNSENRWYCILDNEDGRRQEGPVSGEDLEAMLSAGKIAPDTLVWHEGMTDWEQIGSVSNFSQPSRDDSSPPSPDPESTETSNVDSIEDTAKLNEPSDTVILKETGNHTIRFSKSRNVLLITTNDYHAGPLVLMKLDLLGFLTAMEAATSDG